MKTYQIAFIVLWSIAFISRTKAATVHFLGKTNFMPISGVSYDMSSNYDAVTGKLKNPLPSDPNSNFGGWRIRYLHNSTNCNDGSGDLRNFFGGTFESSYIRYTGLNNPNCLGLRVESDALSDLIEWSPAGISQKPEFGVETYSCNLAEQGVCDANKEVSKISYVGMTLTPTSGEDALSPGKLDIFTYKAKSLNINVTEGMGGRAGLNDLEDVPKNLYCVKKYDASNTESSSGYWYNPRVIARLISTIPIKGGPNAAKGKDSISNIPRINVIEGLDPSLRWLIKKTLY